MGNRQVWIATLLVATAVSGGTSSVANALPFTWNPAGASTPLAGPGSAFTADTIFTTGFLRDVGQPDGTGAAHYFSVVTGFSSGGGSPFLPAGFEPASPIPNPNGYGLYFDIMDTHTNGPPPEILLFSSISVSLKADPGNQNGGMPLATMDGVDFPNTGPTGQADDITLATGSMVTSSSDLDLASGVLTIQSVVTFLPSPGETGFFSGGSGLLDIFSANPANLVMFPPQADGTTITLFNGFTSTAQFVPEPGSIALLGVGLLGLVVLSKRSGRSPLWLARERRAMTNEAPGRPAA
jgi:PEP-CTERM motif